MGEKKKGMFEGERIQLLLDNVGIESHGGLAMAKSIGNYLIGSPICFFFKFPVRRDQIRSFLGSTASS
jgi:hypothetical protein